MAPTFTQVKIGEVFTVLLLEHPSTGYVWTLKNPSDDIMCEVQIKFDATNGFQKIGGLVTKIFSLSLKKAGEFELVFTKIRPWEKTSNPIEVHIENIMARE